MDRWNLAWDGGRCTVFSLGGAVHDLALETGSGTGGFRPLAEAPWRAEAPDARTAGWPAHLATLGGEWPCVPFGTTAHDRDHHGHGANAHWRAVRARRGELELDIRYPPEHPVAGLRRTVRGRPGMAALDLSLVIQARRRLRLPVGLHPIFAWSDDMRILPGGFGHGETFPRPFEPGVSRLQPGARFAMGEPVALADGGKLDVLGAPSALREDLVQLFDCQGPITLIYPAAGIAVTLDWDRAALPHCLLWFSNRGRRAPPWNRRFRGLGVEPVNALFDDDRLLPPAGARRGLLLDPDQPLSLSYSITLRDHPAGNDH